MKMHHFQIFAAQARPPWESDQWSSLAEQRARENIEQNRGVHPQKARDTSGIRLNFTSRLRHRRFRRRFSISLLIRLSIWAALLLRIYCIDHFQDSLDIFHFSALRAKLRSLYASFRRIEGHSAIIEFLEVLNYLHSGHCAEERSEDAYLGWLSAMALGNFIQLAGRSEGAPKFGALAECDSKSRN